MFLLLFLHQVLKMSTPDLAAELSSFPGVPGHAPDLLLAQVHCEVINDGLQLINGLGLTPHHMGQSLSPQWKVQGGQVWWVGGPVVFSVTRDHAITKLGLDEVQAVLNSLCTSFKLWSLPYSKMTKAHCSVEKGEFNLKLLFGLRTGAILVRLSGLWNQKNHWKSAWNTNVP